MAGLSPTLPAWRISTWLPRNPHQFSLRGLLAAASEWCLGCLAYNLKRLHILMAG